MKIIDGENAILGRIASHAAKLAIQGDEVAVVNCDKIIITGNKEFILEEFNRKRARHGSSQKGPIQSKNLEKMVKRTIRGMLPNHRWGVGRAALKRIKCYKSVPKELEKENRIKMEKIGAKKYSLLKEFSK